MIVSFSNSTLLKKGILIHLQRVVFGHLVFVEKDHHLGPYLRIGVQTHSGSFPILLSYPISLIKLTPKGIYIDD